MAIACMSGTVRADSAHSVAESVFGGAPYLNAFLAADHASVARLQHRGEDEVRAAFRAKFNGKVFDENDAAQAQHGHVLIEFKADEPITLSADDAQMLKKLLSEPRSYLWRNEGGTFKACIPDYAVLFTFRYSSSPVRILLCFHCDQMAVLVGTGDDPPRANLEEDFDLIPPQLLALVKRLFPKDAEIQALKMQREP